MRLKALLPLLSWLLYPIVILFGLRFFEARYVALLLLLAQLIRRRHTVKRFMGDLSKLDIAIFSVILLFTIGIAVFNSERGLRFYPTVVNVGMLLLFAYSLIKPPSLIERFARLSRTNHADLPPKGVRYTRQVTVVWCIFFIINGSLAAYTALFSSQELWALYNGFIAYLLMGILFVGEWLFRRFVHKEN